MKTFLILISSALFLISCQSPISGANGSEGPVSRELLAGTLTPLYPYQFGGGYEGGMSLDNVEKYVQLNTDEAVIGIGAREVNHNIVYLLVRAVKINADGSFGAQRDVYAGTGPYEKYVPVPTGYLATGFSIGESNDTITVLAVRSRMWDQTNRKLVGTETNSGSDVFSSELNFSSNNSILMSRNLPGNVPYDPDRTVLSGVGLRAVSSHMNNGVVFLNIAPGTPYTP